VFFFNRLNFQAVEPLIQDLKTCPLPPLGGAVASSSAETPSAVHREAKPPLREVPQWFRTPRTRKFNICQARPSRVGLVSGFSCITQLPRHPLTATVADVLALGAGEVMAHR